MNSLTPAQWLEVVRSQANRIETLEQRLAWFERQLFGPLCCIKHKGPNVLPFYMLRTDIKSKDCPAKMQPRL